MAQIKAEIKLEGFRAFTREIGRAQDGITELKESMRKIGEYVLELARPKVPVRSGKLKGSLAVSNTRASANVYSRVVYANAVHWGTGPRAGKKGPHNIKADRFFYDTVQENKAQIERLVDYELERLAERFNQDELHVTG